ncbi:MAG: hypothetical protein JRJ58_03210, partial [Deltaproteobacteria bacterium]|nr:hypothetical protein [Deltaproteobacteria bacterium]
IPGEISAACERLLIGAAAQDLQEIDALLVHQLLGGDFETNVDSARDEFDTLVSKEEFERAEESPKADIQTSLTEALEHFATPHHDEVLDPTLGSCDASPTASPGLEHDAEPDDGPESASPAPLEGYLSSPAAKELLRAIRGRGLRRLARDAAALTIAAVIAGMAIAWLRGDAPSAVTEGIDAPARVPTRPGPNPAPDVIASPAAGAGIESTPEVLARIRGPVLDAQSPPTPDSQQSGQIASSADSPSAGGPPFPAAPTGGTLDEVDSSEMFR